MDHSAQNKMFPLTKWDRIEFQQRYAEALSNSIKRIDMININSVTSDEAPEIVNKLYNSLCDTIHDCVRRITTQTQKGKLPRKKKHWWDNECTIARDRNRLFFRIWKDCGRPNSGHIYDCYKYARRNYRRICRSAVYSNSKRIYAQLDKLCHEHKPSLLWKRIRSMKNQCNDYNNAININTLKDFFETKFADHNENSQRIQSSHRRVENLYSDLCEKPPEPSFIISEHQIQTYIKQLKSGSAPGLDGVMAEHLKYGINTILPLFLSVLFSLCVRHGTVPKHFCEGLLIPILKKHNLDPSIPSNYRPITVSVIPSKILEFYVLDQCKGYQFSPSQYGFISGRSTHMAATLAGDISTVRAVALQSITAPSKQKERTMLYPIASSLMKHIMLCLMQPGGLCTTGIVI